MTNILASSLTLLLVLCAGCSFFGSIVQATKTGQAAAQSQKWQAPIYKGLAVGKSKRADVERVFGKPIWVGSPEDEYDNPIKDLILYEYENVGGFRGRTSVIMKARTGVITEIFLYPHYENPLTLEQAIQIYGNEYIERESDLGPCPTAREIKKFQHPKERKYPIFLVYPHKGLYISIVRDGTVQEIGFIARCP